MKSNLIVIDGKTYSSVNEMPPDVRAKYEQAMKSLKDKNRNGFPDQPESVNILKDQDGNGIPDIFEGTSSIQISTTNTRIVVNGKDYGSIEELPPDVRAKYEQAIGTMDKNQNGIPDFAEDMLNRIQQTPAQSIRSIPTPAQPSTPTNTSSAIMPDTSSGWRLVLAGGLLLFVCLAGAVGIWFFLLR